MDNKTTIGCFFVAITAKSAYEQMYEIVHDSPYADGSYDYTSDVTWTGYDEEYEQKKKDDAQKEFEGVNTPGKSSSELPIEVNMQKSFGPVEIKISPISIEISVICLIALKANYNTLFIIYIDEYLCKISDIYKLVFL